jgi:hypothetical protein
VLIVAHKNLVCNRPEAAAYHRCIWA